MQFINNLLDEISVFSYHSPILATLFYCLIMYGGIFLVALIGESRVFRFSDFQSKAFFPGDLLLCWILAKILGDWDTIKCVTSIEKIIPRSWLLIIGVVFSITFFVKMRVLDASNYLKRARYSPTKLYHDVLGYLMFSFLFIVGGLPVIVGLACYASKKYFLYNLLRYVLYFVIYIGFVAYDATTGFDEETLEKRHPSDWAPIWKTRKIIRR